MSPSLISKRIPLCCSGGLRRFFTTDLPRRARARRVDTDPPNAACAATTILDCGGKRSATPLLETTGSTESGVAAALCHRSPNLCRPCAKLQDCITEGKEREHNV